MSLPGGGRRWFVIVNPVAGGGRGLDHFPLISKLLRDAGIQTEPVFTEHKFHATELTVSAVKQGFRRIIAVGGDGTLHEVVNGLFIQQTVDPREVLLAVVAVGAGNDWIRTFGVPNRDPRYQGGTFVFTGCRSRFLRRGSLPSAPLYG